MTLSFEEKPNYNKLRFLLEKNLMNLGKAPSKYMDWLEGEPDQRRLS